MLKMISNIFKGIKLNIQYFVEMKNDNSNALFYKSEIIEDSYIIRPNTSAVVKCQGSFCCCMILDFGDIQIPCLYTDILFKIASENCKQFIIYHELGHFNNNHHEKHPEGNLNRQETLEYEADDYAYEKIGKENSVKALQEMIDIATTANFGFKNIYAIQEFERRMNRLMNK